MKSLVLSVLSITYLTYKQKPEEVGNIIEELMMHEPVKKIILLKQIIDAI
jgi:hypothetical protein